MLLSLYFTNALPSVSCSKSGVAPSDVFRQTGNLFRQNGRVDQVTKSVKRGEYRLIIKYLRIPKAIFRNAV